MTITCKYSCPACGLKRVACPVPARMTEPVTVWMEATVRRISADHRLRSPHCHAREMKELLIPMTGTDRIGGPTVQ
jgi:hypothetical protein